MLVFHYKVIRHFLILISVCLGGSALAQNVLIRGKANKAFSGKVIRLSTCTDYITFTRQVETSDTVEADGFFEFGFQAGHTQPVFLQIDNYVGQLYVEPDFVYGITIPDEPEDEGLSRDAELMMNIGVVGTDSTELNALIFDYQHQYNQLFLKDEGRFLSRGLMFKRVDSLQKLVANRYRQVKNEYFRTYVEYSIASLNASLSRGEDFLIDNYIKGKPLRYRHYEYMQFFNVCFKGYLSAMASRRQGMTLFHIINAKADYNLLWGYVKADPALKNDTLRELVLLKNLWDFNFSAEYESDAIKRIVSNLHERTQVTEHRRITSNMLAHMTRLQVGAPAPSFEAMRRDKKAVSLGDFKGRWIYLNFFSTSNLTSLREMPKIAALKKKFGDKVIFVSVCLDDSVDTYMNYLRQNPRFDWLILFDGLPGKQGAARNAYSLTGSEGYFLVDNFGHLSQSPALSPSDGIEYRFNSIFKIRTRTTKTGIR